MRPPFQAHNRLPIIAWFLLVPAAVAVGQDWTPTTAPTTNWHCLACSADGAHLVAAVSDASALGGIYISNNRGTTWAVTTAAIRDWFSVACSADGMRLLGADAVGGVCLSTNGGATWDAANTPEIGCYSVCSSADGSALVAGASGTIYVSSNAGAVWRPCVVPGLAANDVVIGLASSAAGAELVAVTQNGGTGSAGSIYISTNAGLNWESNGLSSYAHWTTVACSADGRIIVAAGYHSGIFVSTNSGSNWTHTNIMSVFSVTCSADGTRLAGVDWSGNIHVSADSGTTWTEANPAGPGTLWFGVASSADGGRLYAAAHGGEIWAIQATPTPLLTTTASSTNLLLSWLVPSMNFVLQQNLDLSSANWADVTEPRSLNYTNIHYEVSVPIPPSNRFYRLILR
jgi:hypothetical protein